MSAFLDAVHEPGRDIISPKRMSSALRLPMTRLAEIARVHRNTLVRQPDSPTAQERLGEVARVVAAAIELLNGDTSRAIIWFRHQPLAGFDGKTAEELLTAGHSRAVLTHLETLQGGGYG